MLSFCVLGALVGITSLAYLSRSSPTVLGRSEIEAYAWDIASDWFDIEQKQPTKPESNTTKPEINKGNSALKDKLKGSNQTPATEQATEPENTTDPAQALSLAEMPDRTQGECKAKAKALIDRRKAGGDRLTLLQQCGDDFMEQLNRQGLHKEIKQIQEA